jgi:HAD superfamily hydrolase (TIGR01484 family)
MRYLALITDYDGTLAVDGKIQSEALEALKRLRTSGRRVILATGRRLDDLRSVLPNLEIFDCVVAENGALLYVPQTREEFLLSEPPPQTFIERLNALGVAPLEIGRAIVSTWMPHQNAVLKAIQESGLELLIVFNKNALMVLRTGVNKASGLSVALRRFGLSFHEAVGVGDGENDHSFLERCECSVAVSNSAPSILKLADVITKGAAGIGVAELVNELIEHDLSRSGRGSQRNQIVLGIAKDGNPIAISPYGINMLIAGPSGSGKSTITTGIVERLIERKYQVCVVDPEGDYGNSIEVVALGDRTRAISVNEVLGILEDPQVNLSLNLLGIDLADRPGFFGQLLPSLRTLRTRTGRPHWLVFDEAHHLIPVEWGHLPEILPHKLGETIFITMQPDHLPKAVLAMTDVVIAVGPSPETTLKNFCNVLGQGLEWPQELRQKPGHAVVWFPAANRSPQSMRIIPSIAVRIRHRRKYAEGNMHHHSFFFRGPDNRHNLRAHNLAIFTQIAEGIDEETWLFHLRRHDYSAWLRDAVKDRYVAEQVAKTESQYADDALQSRKLIRALIDARYTLPA